MKWYIVEQLEDDMKNVIGPFPSKEEATEARDTEFSTMVDLLTVEEIK